MQPTTPISGALRSGKSAGASLQSYREQLRSELESGRLLRLCVIAAEFALIVAAIRLLNIETSSFELVVTMALGGFLVHHFLPASWRQTFFAMLSVASVLVVFGWGYGAWMLGMGGLLIALCHLPVAWGLRVALVLLVAAAMAAARVQVLPVVSSSIPTSVWPILGAMFMFRLIVYLYDIKHAAAPFGVGRALSYFFMLPNVCFPLFPVVDYKTFQRSAYNDDALRLYQTGVKWMLRGLVHLVLYKIVYFKGVIEPGDALNGLDAARYMICTYLLYLKISGLFHLIVGLLHMFGYGLAETHHLYLFSSSFTDFWRRINIYWKDFIQKLVFNPVYFVLRKLGEVWAITVATLIAFTATWLFHSYQWFWIRGEFPIVWSDLVFWLGLGVVVLVNVLLETRKGRRRSLEKKASSINEEVVHGLKIAATFATMCTLWTIWSTPKVHELESVGKALLNSGALDVAVLVGVPLGVGVLGVLFGKRKREAGAGSAAAAANAFWPQVVMVSAVAGAFIVVALRPALLQPVSPELASLVTEVGHGVLNAADSKKLQRGYYEDLGDVTRFNGELWNLYGGTPKSWGDTKLTRVRTDAIGVEFVPSTSEIYKGVMRTINSYGLRDREYALERAPNTFRIALIGASHDEGAGVRDDETYENVVEDRLNRELGPRTGLKYEVLNFSHGGFNLVQKIAVIEQRMLPLKPDLVLYVAHSYELDWAFKSIDHLVKYRLLDQFPFVGSALGRAGIKLEAGKPLPEEKSILESKLAPYAEDALRAVLERLRNDTVARGMGAALVLLEIPQDTPLRDKFFVQLAGLGQSVKLPVLDLRGSFPGVENRKLLCIAEWDCHTNAQGHRMIADRLYSLLLGARLVPMDARLVPDHQNNGK